MTTQSTHEPQLASSSPTEQPAQRHESQEAKEHRHGAHATETGVPPCPSWCALPAGHGLDDLRSKGFRVHTASPSNALVEILGCQVGDALDSLEPTERPFIWYDLMDEHGSATDARAIAAMLLAVADRLDEINGAK